MTTVSHVKTFQSPNKCMEYIRSHLPNQITVIFDIDDTLLDSRQRPIKHSQALYKWIQASTRAPKIHIVTARPPSPGNRRYTIQDLHKGDFKDYATLNLTTNKNRYWAMYKPNLNVGNLLSDLVSDYEARHLGHLADDLYHVLYVQRAGYCTLCCKLPTTYNKSR